MLLAAAAGFFLRNQLPRLCRSTGDGPIGGLSASLRITTPSGLLLDRGMLFDARAMASHITNQDAEIRFIVFEDFSCSWCAKLDSNLRTLKLRFPDLFSVAYRELLLDSLAINTRDTHVAARCAADQGSFEPFHRAAFDNQLIVADPGGWRRIARIALVPDQSKLEACVEHQLHLSEVLASSRDANALGYSSTPVIIAGDGQFIGEMEFPDLVAVVESTIVRRRRQ